MKLFLTLLAIVAGSLIHLSLAPYNLWLTAFTGITVFAALISLSASAKQIFLTSFAFGTGLFGAGVSWVYVSIHIYGEVPAPLAFVFTAGFVLFLALLFALPWLLLTKIASSQTQRLICFPVFWFISEWLRGWLLTGFPWLYLGYGQVQGPLAGWMPIIGVLGIGALMAICSSLIVYAANMRQAKAIVGCLVSLALIFSMGAGLKQVEWTNPMQTSVPVTLVQPDIALRDKWNPAKTYDIVEILEEQSQQAWQPGLLIWPEAAIPFTGPRAKPYIDFLDSMASSSDTAMITGLLSYDHEQERYLNSIIGLGSADNIYHKQRLVPFGEYVPLESWLRGLMYFFDLPMSVISAGPADQNLLEFSYQGQPFSIAPAICYEIAYAGLVSSLAAEANMIVTLSNDAWFGTSIGPWQHMQIAQARALENQKPVLRITNNGVTGVISYEGKIVKAIPQFKSISLDADIEPRSGSTLMHS